MFVHSIAEEIRKDLVLLVQSADFFSVCMDSSTNKATIDEEMVQVRLLKNNRLVYRFRPFYTSKVIWFRSGFSPN